MNAAGRGAIAGLALVLAGLAAAAFLPGTALWGLDWLRFLPPASWLAWAAAALAFVPAVGRRLGPAAARFGDATARRPLVAGAALGTALVALVLLFPDRTRYLGDFLMRQGMVEQATTPQVIIPQAMPLDVLLHVRLPELLVGRVGLPVNAVARLHGAVVAFLLGLVAVQFARALRLKGAAAATAVAAVAFGGALLLCTGFGKAYVETALLAALVGALGVRLAGEGRGVLPLCLATAAYFGLHRSAPVLLPGVAFALVAATRGGRGLAPFRRPAALVGLAVLAATMALTLPHIIGLLRGFDMSHHLAGEDVRRGGGLLAATFGLRRLADLANLVVVLCPLAPAALLAALGSGVARTPVRWDAGHAFLLVHALSFAALAWVSFPQGGVFRDLDVFAANGVAWACLAAAALAGTVAALPARAGAALAATATAVTLASSGLALAHFADRDRGLERVEAIVAGPPERTPAERAGSLDFLGASYLQLRRLGDAARTFERLTQVSPNPRYYLQWGMAAQEAGDLPQARRAFSAAAARQPGNFLAWQSLGSVSWRLGDLETAHRAAQQLVQLAPGNADVVAGAQLVERAYAAWRDSVARAGAGAGADAAPEAGFSRAAVPPATAP